LHPIVTEPAVQGTAAEAVRLKLTGTPSLVAASTSDPQPLTANDAALLALLAADGPQPRTALASMLWPDKDAATAATNLRQRLHRLKRVAGAPVVVGERTLALAASVQHDLHDLHRWSVNTPELGAGRLLGLHEFVDNDGLSSWLSAQRQTRAHQRAHLLMDGAQACVAQGQHQQALQLARLLTTESPLSEPAHRLLIELLHQAGDRAGALAAYEQCVAALASQLGIAPSEATRALLAQLQAVDAPARHQTSAMPLSLLRPPRLVARDEAWRLMSQCASQHQALLIEGEAGMGKSRLLGDFVATSSAWLLVAAYPGDHSLPYALLARLLQSCTAGWGRPDEAWVNQELARLVPEAGAPASDAFATLRLQQAVRAALLHWQRKGLAGLALDDLHYADTFSMALLLPLTTARETAHETVSLTWFLATRPPTSTHGLDELQRLTLLPLSLVGVQELLASLALVDLRIEQWAPALLQRTGGNPLYLLQTLTAAFESRTLQGEPPDDSMPTSASILTLLTARLEKLSAPARAIARLASVAGPDFTVELACRLLQVTPTALADPWLELQTAHVMQGGRFAHDLIRDASALITPQDLRLLMHAQVAAALAAHRAPPGRVAEHWDAAKHWKEAALAYEGAAAHAHDCSAVADELLKLQAATRCHRACATPEALAAAFVTAHRELELRVANTQLGLDTQHACQALLANAQTDEQRGLAQVLLAHYWCECFEPERGLTHAQAAMHLAQGCNSDRLALLAAQRAGGALSRMGRYPEAVQSFRPRSGQLQSLTRDERLNWRTDFGLTLDYADQRQESLQVLDAVIDEAKECSRWSAAASALSLKCNALTYLGRTRDGLLAMEQAMALHRRAGVEGSGLLVDEATYVGFFRDLGEFNTYLQRAEHLPQALRAVGSDFWAANAEHDLATAYAWLGRADLALRMLSSQDPDSLPPLMKIVRLVTRARLARDHGVSSSTDPQALLQQAQTLLAATKAPGRSHFSLAIAVMVARDAEPAEALGTVTQIEAEGLQRQNMMLAGGASCMRLRLLLASGDEASAAAVATALLQRIEPHGVPAALFPPELWWLAYQALRVHQPALAKTTLLQAAQWLRRTALEHVPDHHRQSFLTRNPVNRAVLAAAQKLGL
jgi:DNA-binding SARP family transcriptional activator